MHSKRVRAQKDRQYFDAVEMYAHGLATKADQEITTGMVDAAVATLGKGQLSVANFSVAAAKLLALALGSVPEENRVVVLDAAMSLAIEMNAFSEAHKPIEKPAIRYDA